MDKIKNLERLIAESSAITVAVHTHPDGDALGSGLALAGFLRDCLGKDVRNLIQIKGMGCEGCV